MKSVNASAEIKSGPKDEYDPENSVQGLKSGKPGTAGEIAIVDES